MKIFLLLTALMASTPAFANFSGHWIVKGGKVNSTVGISADCSQIELVIEQNESVLRTKVYKADCGNYSSHWGPVDQFVRGGKVYEGEGEDEEEVGTISEDTLITVSRSGSVSYAYNLKLHANPDGSKSLQTYYGVKNMVGTIVIEGVAQPAKP